jgi:hypothetical protein
MTRKARKDPLVWGVILIILGLIFLLDRLDVDIWDSVARLWPVILVLWGGWKLYFGIKERNVPSKSAARNGTSPNEIP